MAESGWTELSSAEGRKSALQRDIRRDLESVAAVVTWVHIEHWALLQTTKILDL